jgi:Zn-dependent protease
MSAGAGGPVGQWRARNANRRAWGRRSNFEAWVRANGVFSAVLVALLGVLVYGIVRKHILTMDDLYIVIAFVPAVILHEVSHGVVALWCGDDTAKQAKRLTLNPLRHIDPVGSIIVPLLLLFTVHSAFGWAKPVPVRIDRLRHPRNQSVLVGLAGPATNIILSAIAGALLYVFYRGDIVSLGGYIYYKPGLSALAWILFYFGVINLVVAAFNLIPIPPLDGSALLERVIPVRYLPGYYRVRMAMLVVVVFVVIAFRTGLSDLFGWLEAGWLHVFG